MCGPDVWEGWTRRRPKTKNGLGFKHDFWSITGLLGFDMAQRCSLILTELAAAAWENLRTASASISGFLVLPPRRSALSLLSSLVARWAVAALFSPSPLGTLWLLCSLLLLSGCCSLLCSAPRSAALFLSLLSAPWSMHTFRLSCQST